VTIKTPIQVTPSEYVEYVMEWVEVQLDDVAVLGGGSAQGGSADGRDLNGAPGPRIKKIFTRLYRVYVLLYTRQLDTLEAVESVEHLNTCFKHFTFFCFEFGLVNENDYNALPGPTSTMRVRTRYYARHYTR
jgi:MOB kinase activator 1